MQMIWPEIFDDPDMDFFPGVSADKRKGAALGIQLVGWANCMAGAKPPKGFGKAMAALSIFTGVSGLHDVTEAAKAWPLKI